MGIGSGYRKKRKITVIFRYWRSGFRKRALYFYVFFTLSMELFIGYFGHFVLFCNILQLAFSCNYSCRRDALGLHPRPNWTCIWGAVDSDKKHQNFSVEQDWIRWKWCVLGKANYNRLIPYPKFHCSCIEIEFLCSFSWEGCAKKVDCAPLTC